MKKKIGMFFLGMFFVASANAQQTYQELEQITVNEQVTTVVTASEPIHFVDVSTDKVAGDKPIDNTVRFKPKEGGHADGEVLAIVTIITERYRTQYALVYTTKMEEAVSDKEIMPQERMNYTNPAVSLSTEDMTRFARRVWNSPAKIHNIKSRKHRVEMRLNNVYAVGEYFFIDFSVENKTNIRFDIDELTPSLVLDKCKSFLHGYRNVIVIKKMTFPNDKVVVIELSEKQISGRTISISIDYEDVLSADAFDKVLLQEE